jgi:hypothetical protein
LLSALTGIFAFGQNIEFIENKGQWDKRVLFMGQLSNGAFYIERNGYTVVQHNASDLEMIHTASHQRSIGGKPITPDKEIIVHSHAYSVSFEGGAASPEVTADKPIYTYNNYMIGNDPSKWASNCRIFPGSYHQ